MLWWVFILVVLFRLHWWILLIIFSIRVDIDLQVNIIWYFDRRENKRRLRLCNIWFLRYYSFINFNILLKGHLSSSFYLFLKFLIFIFELIHFCLIWRRRLHFLELPLTLILPLLLLVRIRWRTIRIVIIVFLVAFTHIIATILLFLLRLRLFHIFLYPLLCSFWFLLFLLLFLLFCWFLSSYLCSFSYISEVLAIQFNNNPFIIDYLIQISFNPLCSQMMTSDFNHLPVFFITVLAYVEILKFLKLNLTQNFVLVSQLVVVPS